MYSYSSPQSSSALKFKSHGHRKIWSDSDALGSDSATFMRDNYVPRPTLGTTEVNKMAYFFSISKRTTAPVSVADTTVTLRTTNWRWDTDNSVFTFYWKPKNGHTTIFECYTDAKVKSFSILFVSWHGLNCVKKEFTSAWWVAQKQCRMTFASFQKSISRRIFSSFA